MSQERIPEGEQSETDSVEQRLDWQRIWPPMSYWSKAALLVLGVVITVRILAVLQNILLIVIAAFVISLGLQPAIRWMEEKGLKRGAAMAVLLLVALAVMAGAAENYVIAPRVMRKAVNLNPALPVAALVKILLTEFFVRDCMEMVRNEPEEPVSKRRIRGSTREPSTSLISPPGGGRAGAAGRGALD